MIGFFFTFRERDGHSTLRDEANAEQEIDKESVSGGLKVGSKLRRCGHCFFNCMVGDLDAEKNRTHIYEHMVFVQQLNQAESK